MIIVWLLAICFVAGCVLGLIFLAICTYDYYIHVRKDWDVENQHKDGISNKR